MSEKLTRGSITLADMIRVSRDLFKSGKVDDKQKRAKLDVVTAKVTATHNFEYNKVTKLWEDINKRSIKFEFMVKTDPISYENKSGLKYHYYPVTILLYSIEDGVNSEFRYRSGSLRKPLFAPKGSTAEKRKKIEVQNIRNGVDMWFFFNLEAVLRSMNLLYGVCYANRMPNITNPKKYVYFEKHSWACITKVLLYILNNPQAMSKIKGLVYKNESRIEKTK